MGLLAMALLVAAGGEVARAASLDGAGRMVVLPFAVSGPQRETTVYITNPSPRPITVHALYVGAEGTPFEASKQPGTGAVFCDSTRLEAGESQGRRLSSLCPISTPDVENLGYLEFITYGSWDSAPFEVTSLVDVVAAGHFGVDGVPTAAFDPGQTAFLRAGTLRVHDLMGDVATMMPAEHLAHCAVATLGEKKTVTVQLQEYSSGMAKPFGSPVTVTLPPWRMQFLGDIFQRAGLPPGRHANVTAEFYADSLPWNPVAGDAGGLIATCSVENVSSRLADVRLAGTPSPRDGGRTRSVARGDSNFVVGPWSVGYLMPLGKKAVMSVYLRHEDRVRCYLTESDVFPNGGVAPWQELRVLDPDGNIVAGGSDMNDTGVFGTGVKNARHAGVNDRWTIEISWREARAGDYSQIPNANRLDVFGVECSATNGVSGLLPLDTRSDDF
jgi:hypothetical protein